MDVYEGQAVVKENPGRALVRERWLVLGAASCVLAALALQLWGARLPEPARRGAPPDSFIAELAHEHLVNLTSIGPRVAGSYENEVAAVRVLVAAARALAAGAAPHHRLELDVHAASGAFPLAFLDGTAPAAGAAPHHRLELDVHAASGAFPLAFLDGTAPAAGAAPHHRLELDVHAASGAFPLAFLDGTAPAAGAAPHHRLELDVHAASGAFPLAFLDGTAPAAGAAPHHRLELDVHAASGAFPLAFLDGTAPAAGAAPHHRLELDVHAASGAFPLAFLDGTAPAAGAAPHHRLELDVHAASGAFPLAFLDGTAPAAGAAPHHRLELDVHAASGAFPLAFLDGMNNVYRDVQSVVIRLSARGGRPTPPARRAALLINCHFDTVPDSPGGSDDAAGCAVALEVLRALAAAPAPHAHDVILLLNGAEENIMQGSHAFVTTHPWAASVRAFVNLEACGAGGREVLFQAGPAAWLLEAYAAAAPRPFASSLAQDLFESHLIPADTDFRIFRDFGNLSGVDFAWSANGYVYHTRLDTAERAPPAALQRTGDNVLALARGLLAGGRLARGAEAGAEAGAGRPVFFDVLGLCVVCVGPGAARALAALALAGVALRLHVHAGDARATLYMSRRAWWRLVGGALGRLAAAAAGGVAAAAALGAALHAAGARLAFYRSPWLLAPLYAAPAVGVSWLLTLRLLGGGAAGRGAPRLAGDAAAAGWSALLLGCAGAGLRSGFVPALWAAAAAAGAAPAAGGAELALGAAAAALPALLTGAVALDALAVLVPVMGRAGPVPHDVLLGALAGALALAATSWLLPLVLAVRPRRLPGALLALAAAAALLVLATPLGAPYSPTRPMRLMVFHTRRTDHRSGAVEAFFWTPDLDANSPHALAPHVPLFRRARPTAPEECARWVYCGAPYHLPAAGFIPRGHSAPAPAPPLTTLNATLSMQGRTLAVVARGPAHVVLAVAPAPGARLAGYRAEGAGGGAALEALEALEALRWGARRTYFFTLHDARPARAWHLRLHFDLDEGAAEPAYWADVSLAGHSLFGPHKEAPALRDLLAALPPYAAPAATGWGVDLHLYRV